VAFFLGAVMSKSVFEDPILLDARDNVQNVLEKLCGKMKLGFLELNTGNGKISIPVPETLIGTFAKQQQLLLELHRQSILNGAILKAIGETLEEGVLEGVIMRAAELTNETVARLCEVADAVEKEAAKPKSNIQIANGPLPPQQRPFHNN
jgi:hypothetical protein